MTSNNKGAIGRAQNVADGWVSITPATPRKRRIAAIIGGIEKTGKTTLAGSGDDPVYLLSIDRGSEVLALKSAGRQIYMRKYLSPREAQPGQHEQVWAQFKSDFYGVLKVGKGTLIVDTETSMYEIIRLARFGKLTQVTPEQYGPINAELTAMMDAAFETEMNIIMVRRTAAEYAGRQRTGGWEDRGWNQMPFIMDMRIWTYRCMAGMCQVMRMDGKSTLHPAGNGFHARIRDSRWRHELVGMDYSTEPPNLLSLQVIASHVFDGVQVQMPVMAPVQPTATQPLAEGTAAIADKTEPEPTSANR